MFPKANHLFIVSLMFFRFFLFFIFFSCERNKDVTNFSIPAELIWMKKKEVIYKYIQMENIRELSMFEHDYKL